MLKVSGAPALCQHNINTIGGLLGSLAPKVLCEGPPFSRGSPGATRPTLSSGCRLGFRRPSAPGAWGRPEPWPKWLAREGLIMFFRRCKTKLIPKCCGRALLPHDVLLSHYAYLEQWVGFQKDSASGGAQNLGWFCAEGCPGSGRACLERPSLRTWLGEGLLGSPAPKCCSPRSHKAHPEQWL